MNEIPTAKSRGFHAALNPVALQGPLKSLSKHPEPQGPGGGGEPQRERSGRRRARRGEVCGWGEGLEVETWPSAGLPSSRLQSVS